LTTKICTVGECERTAWARGWCTLHLQRWKATGDPEGLKGRPPGKGRKPGFQHSEQTKDRMRASTVRHGMSHTPTHISWASNGGRGITICARWLVFDNFLTDMGVRPANRTLDRVDNDGNYEPGNCRWATRSQQVRNRRTREQMRTSQAPLQNALE
jgi:hypothetical protein